MLAMKPHAKITAVSTNDQEVTTVDLQIYNNRDDHPIDRFQVSLLGRVTGSGGNLATGWVTLDGPCRLPVGGIVPLIPLPVSIARTSGSSYKLPVIVGDDGSPMDYATGIRWIRYRAGLSCAELGAVCGVSERTVEGWEQGRMPSAPALLAMARLLE